MTGFEALPANLRDSSGLMASAAEALTSAWNELDSKVQGMGDIFGDDDVGGLIGMSYQAAHDIATENMTSIIEALGGFGEGLQGMATGYEENEAAVEASFGKFER
ncbi:WXG100 family type VII secretion target [Phytomonospora endophytica]|uniref:Uncharacterized protein YukE n=1 Tax=Phytomonospora endophytica TaxID=714109 RepID=A0A841FYN6_9ACTN|nr:hypothetical protein [Phytomonospora endophytica]MBB6037549.1 uncharacterized protein YukE [Phytomonospora endophytica]GIG70250.1 hypothetical protein Pen01_65450 [Phytomonospora endophytica]